MKKYKKTRPTHYLQQLISAWNRECARTCATLTATSRHPQFATDQFRKPKFGKVGRSAAQEEIWFAQAGGPVIAYSEKNCFHLKPTQKLINQKF
tara:strand:+ start:266 stop:547 length:282 start_codon:yes stop_codon:yes gene_type:complete